MLGDKNHSLKGMIFLNSTTTTKKKKLISPTASQTKQRTFK